MYEANVDSSSSQCSTPRRDLENEESSSDVATYDKLIYITFYKYSLGNLSQSLEQLYTQSLIQHTNRSNCPIFFTYLIHILRLFTNNPLLTIDHFFLIQVYGRRVSSMDEHFYLRLHFNCATWEQVPAGLRMCVARLEMNSVCSISLAYFHCFVVVRSTTMRFWLFQNL